MGRIYVEFDDSLVDDDGNLRLTVLESLKAKQAAGTEIWMYTRRSEEEIQTALTVCHNHGLDFDGVERYEQRESENV